ncbi:hypothetical protein PsYK624_159320 [Phanerochaete sordida]|uniref:Uncharacterized protein n=1 Tax=Phanerochaete sordida TaxID=48140 RepID=A0A9P3GRU7_9APHY|nr:hypothetical protein PsYK624_159320 [Phanerochaete sordida]
MYRQPSEHAYPRPPQHQGAIMAHDEYSQASQTFYPQYPQQSAYSRAAPQPDPSYYQPQSPPARQASIYGPPLAQSQQPQQMHSQRPIRSRPIPASQFKEDPAFSPDPRSNPLAGFTNFTMNSKEEIVPAAGTQGQNTPPNTHGSASKRDPSAIYAYPPAPPVTPASATSQYPPPSLQPFPSAGSHHSRPPSEGDSFYTRSSFTSSAPSHNGSHPRDPRGSNDASSVRLAYDDADADERVIPPEPSSAARQSYYSKYGGAEPDEPRRPEEQSSRKLHKARHEDKDKRQMSQASLASSANTSYSSSKSSSASSFARAQSGGVSIASSKSKSSLRVVNPDPYAIFTPPQHSPDSSASSIISSSEGPHTPPSFHGHFDPNSPFPSSEKGYTDDKRLRREKSKEAAMAHDEEHEHHHEHAHKHGHATVEAPPAYSPLPTPTETVAAAGPSRGHDSKIEYSTGPVQVTLTPSGITLDPLQPSTSQASASSSSSRKARREAANDLERPELPQANVSAPELHVPPQREEPVRPTTVPIAAPAPAVAATMSSAPSAGGPSAPPLAKSRSRKPSIATPPKDLDKIDELDESDPLGVAWHMAGPYDAIPRPVKIIQPDAHGGEGGRPKIFAAQAGGHGQGAHSSSGGGSHGRRKHMVADPSITSFAVKPGQLFPLIAQPAYPPPPLAAPAPSQAPFSPTMRQAYVNNHMVPGATAPERPPPLFSPTPSEMARQHSARDLRRDRRERERESVSLNEPNLSGVGTAYASTLSEGHSTSGSSGFASFASAHAAMPRSNERGRTVPPPMQMQREQHMHPHDQHQHHEEHNVLHRPHPHPVQPMAGMPPEQQLKPQSSRSSLSRARSAPNSAPPSAPPSSAPSTNSSHSHHSSHHSHQQQVLSNEPPPTPDIQLPPPPPPPQSSQSIPPPPGSMRSGAPSMHSSATGSSGRSQMPPSNRYMPRKLVMPTPLQPMQPLPGTAPAPAASYAPSARSASSGAQGAPLKHSQTVPSRAARPAAQEIPISQGKNVLRKHKENGQGAPERVVRSQSSRANMGAANASSASLGRESRRGEPAGAPGATAVWAGHVVVVPEEKKKGGLGALFGFGGGGGGAAKEREREREREKERVLAERARENERARTREGQREREKKKLSKARR